MNDQMRQFFEISQALGVLKFIGPQQITSFNLAFQPFVSTKEYHERLGRYQGIWQKLFFKIHQDPQLLIRLFQPLIEKDYMVKRLFGIYQKSLKYNKQDGIVFSRADYYNDMKGDPKMTEYNTFSIGMQSHQEQFQEAKKLADFDHKHMYPGSATIRCFADTLSVFMGKKGLKGLFLFVMLPNDLNFFDQKRLQIQIIKKGIKVKRVTIQSMYEHISRDEKDNIYYQKEAVSIVYYRGGYRNEHFSINGDVEKGWKLKEEIELSTAYTLPPISMELINQKRVQTEMTKPQVIRQYLSDQDAKELQKTFVRQWDFDTLSQEKFQAIINLVKQKPEAFILKPNLEGGGNNLYGEEIVKKLQNIGRQESRIYILMEKICSKSYQNQMMTGKDFFQQNCLYEISRLGAFCWIDNELVANEVSGFLLRAKPETADQGGIMTGIGSIVTWKVTEE